MSESNQPSEPLKKSQVNPNFAVYSVGGQIGCATLVIVLVALFAGIGLDTLLGTKPVLTIIFTLGSAPFSLFLTYKLAMRAVNSMNSKPPAAPHPKPVEEEEKRE
jgi:F0F1-type ATP synthase assembly protein I